MDYKRIYEEFIKDRKIIEKEFKSNDYIELHHIIPKCMNGNDKKEILNYRKKRFTI